MNRFRLLILYVCVSLASPLGLKSQYFLHEGQPCPGSEKDNIKLDTFFYSPDKSFPFDRCFILSFRLPGKPNLYAFSVVPVNKYGEKDVRRRDYNAFMKSARVSRKNRKLVASFEQFHNPKQKINLLFKNIGQAAAGDYTNYYLKIPPLDPNRSYRLFVEAKDLLSIQKLRAVEDGLHEMRNGLVINTATQEQAREDYNNILQARKNDALNLTVYSFDEMAARLYDCNSKVFLDSNYSPAIDTLLARNAGHVTQLSRTYRFYIAPIGTTVTDAQLLAPNNNHYVFFIADEPLPSIAVFTILARMQQKNIRDAAGNTINYGAANNQSIYLVTIDTLRVPGRIDTAIVNTHYRVADITWAASGAVNAAGAPVADDFLRITAITPAITPPTPCDNHNFAGFQSIRTLKIQIRALAERALPNCQGQIIDYAMKKALQCPCEKEGVKDITQKDDLLRSLALLYRVSDTTFRNIIYGYVSYKDPFNAVSAADIDGRSAAVKTSVAQLYAAKEFLVKLRPDVDQTGQNAIDAQLICIDTIALRLQKMGELLKRLGILETKRNDFYADSLLMYKSSALGQGTTEVFDFVSTNKFRIVPDFGFIGIFKGSGVAFQDLSPYLGFHINFRSIDKSIAMKYVRYKTWRHYFSFMAGITLRSMKIEGKREDFFGNNNLITGLGFRCNNYLRFTGGLVWFRTIDKNPLSTDKPLGFSPFAGISLDLELQDLFGGIAKLFK